MLGKNRFTNLSYLGMTGLRKNSNNIISICSEASKNVFPIYQAANE